MSLRRALWLWGPVAGFVGLLYVSSSQPGSSVPVLVWDKLLHAAGYAILGVTALRAFHGGIAPLRRGPSAGALLFTVGHGIFDEIHQSFVPGRDASTGDVVADAVGAAIAVAIVHAWARRRREDL